MKRKFPAPFKINASRYRIGIVVSRFHSDITDKLLTGALTILKESEVKKENIDIYYVPGSFEMPLALKRMASTGNYQALIALGCVIKGETDHYYYIAGQASRGVMQVMLESGLPIGFGLITAGNLKQAKARITAGNNKGAEAAIAALMMIKP